MPVHLPLRLGLTLWSHPRWQQQFYGRGTDSTERLAKYAQVFHTVEGNTTFYASPSPATVQHWKSATHDQFRFTFKLPKQITHELMLQGCQAPLTQFMQLMAPLHERIGQWTIQLPAAFSPEYLPRLQQFCQMFPKDFPLGIEVRHAAFFAKGEAEKTFNQWLHQAGIDRIIMDSRPVFAAPPETEAVIDAHRKKPKVPVHAIATAKRPMIRFIGHPDLEENLSFFSPWLSKLTTWIQEGRQPYLMIHTPDNINAPTLAVMLYRQLNRALSQQHPPEHAVRLPDLPPFPAQSDHQQLSMF